MSYVYEDRGWFLLCRLKGKHLAGLEKKYDYYKKGWLTIEKDMNASLESERYIRDTHMDLHMDHSYDFRILVLEDSRLMDPDPALYYSFTPPTGNYCIW